MAVTEIGTNIKIHSSGRKKEEGDETHLLITSHGGDLNKMFTVPEWTNLHFYAPHGHVLSDPTVYNMLKGEFQVVESVPGGARCWDYDLSKFQARNSNVPTQIGRSATETYESIADNIQKNEKALTNQADKDYYFGGKSGAKGRNFGFFFDVLTIRSRWNLTVAWSITLSQVLQQLASHRKYGDIHCSFCRGGQASRKATEFGT